MAATTAITGTVLVTISCSGDLVGYVPTQIGFINTNAAMVEQAFIFTGAGDNTITVPTSGAAPQAVWILPPAGNTQAITFKGLGADTGSKLHKTIPSMITLDPSVTSFVLNVAGTVTNIKFLWI